MEGEQWRNGKEKGICNANGCPATLNNSKCWMEILLFWSPVINFCRSGPFSFGLFWPAHLPFSSTPPPFSPSFLSLLPCFLSVLLLLPTLPPQKPLSLVFIETPHACCPPLQVLLADKPRRSPSYRSVWKELREEEKRPHSVFMALISLYSWSVDYTLPAAMGDTDGEPLWGPSLSSSY